MGVHTILTSIILLLATFSKYIECREWCHYYNNNDAGKLNNVWCPGRCCYVGNNYYSSKSATCCAYGYTNASYWWIALPLLFFASFILISVIKVCCFKGRPMVFGRRRQINIPARNPHVIIPPSNNGYNPGNNNYYNNGSVANQSMSYPRQAQYQSGIQNGGYTGNLEINNISKSLESDPPRYEDLTLNNHKEGEITTPAFPAPIGFKNQS